jgi:hypothetical protein
MLARAGGARGRPASKAALAAGAAALGVVGVAAWLAREPEDGLAELVRRRTAGEAGDSDEGLLLARDAELRACGVALEAALAGGARRVALVAAREAGRGAALRALAARRGAPLIELPLGEQQQPESASAREWPLALRTWYYARRRPTEQVLCEAVRSAAADETWVVELGEGESLRPELAEALRSTPAAVVLGTDFEHGLTMVAPPPGSAAGQLSVVRLGEPASDESRASRAATLCAVAAGGAECPEELVRSLEDALRRRVGWRLQDGLAVARAARSTASDASVPIVSSDSDAANAEARGQEREHERKCESESGSERESERPQPRNRPPTVAELEAAVEACVQERSRELAARLDACASPAGAVWLWNTLELLCGAAPASVGSLEHAQAAQSGRLRLALLPPPPSGQSFEGVLESAPRGEVAGGEPEAEAAAPVLAAPRGVCSAFALLHGGAYGAGPALTRARALHELQDLSALRADLEEYFARRGALDARARAVDSLAALSPASPTLLRARIDLDSDRIGLEHLRRDLLRRARNMAVLP